MPHFSFQQKVYYERTLICTWPYEKKYTKSKFSFKKVSFKSLLTFVILNNTHRKKLCFTSLVQEWLLGCF